MNGDPHDRFWAAARQALLPLGLWAAGFAFAYGAVVAACGAAALLPLLLGAGTLLAAWLALLAVRAARRLRRRESAAAVSAARVRLLAAVLALVALVWTFVPLPWLPACGGWGIIAGIGYS